MSTMTSQWDRSDLNKQPPASRGSELLTLPDAPAQTFRFPTRCFRVFVVAVLAAMVMPCFPGPRLALGNGKEINYEGW